MFDIGWSELLLIGVVALIAIGPKELPGALRAVGQWTGKIRRMASEFQDQFREAMREAEMADIKKDVEEKIAALREALKGDDTQRMKTAMEELRQASMKIGEAMNKQQQPSENGQPQPEGEPAGATAGDKKKDGDTIEGEFKEQS